MPYMPRIPYLESGRRPDRAQSTTQELSMVKSRAEMMDAMVTNDPIGRMFKRGQPPRDRPGEDRRGQAQGRAYVAIDLC